MKIRAGFVSNSSSSSFVVGKYFMTEDQIRAFKNGARIINEEFDGGDYGTYLEESTHYFYGEVDYDVYDAYKALLGEIGVGSDKAN